MREAKAVALQHLSVVAKALVDEPDSGLEASSDLIELGMVMDSASIPATPKTTPRSPLLVQKATFVDECAQADGSFIAPASWYSLAISLSRSAQNPFPVNCTASAVKATATAIAA